MWPGKKGQPNSPLPPPKKKLAILFQTKKNHGVFPHVFSVSLPPGWPASHPSYPRLSSGKTCLDGCGDVGGRGDAATAAGGCRAMRRRGVTGQTLGTETDLGTKCGRSLGMWGSETHVITEFVAFGRVVAGIKKNVLMKRMGGVFVESFLKIGEGRVCCVVCFAFFACFVFLLKRVANCNPTKNTPATFTVISQWYLKSTCKS